MRFRFWSSLFLSVFLPLSVVFAWGFHFIVTSQDQNQERYIQNLLKRDQSFYSQTLDSKMKELKTQIGASITSQNIDGQPFAALGIIHSSKKLIKKIHLSEKQTDNARQITRFVKKHTKKNNSYFAKNKMHFEALTLKNNLKKQKVYAFFLDQPNLISKQALADINSEKPKSLATDYIIFGIIENTNFFNLLNSPLANKEGQEVFLSNKQGQILFHNKEQYMFKKLSDSSSIRKSIERLYFINKRFVNTYKEGQVENVSRIQKLNDSNLFLVNKFPWQPHAALAQTWLLKWLIFCLIIACFIGLGLLYTVYPVFSAYNYLKYFFTHFAKTGDLFIGNEKLKNPYLSFYKNRIDILQSRLEELKAKKSQNTNNKDYTFRKLLKEEVQKIKAKYPNLNVIERIDDNVKLFHFTDAMTIILHQLILNAVESMGGRDVQDVFVSCKNEDDNFVFSVKDSGVGLSQKDYGKAFELYYSTKSQLGVGLNLVQAIVQSQDGKIDFLPAHPEGLEVVVSLPKNCFVRSYSKVSSHLIHSPVPRQSLDQLR